MIVISGSRNLTNKINIEINRYKQTHTRPTHKSKCEQENNTELPAPK